MSAALHTPAAAASFPRRALAAAIDGLLTACFVQALHWSVALVFVPRLESALAWHLYLLATVSLPCWVYYTWSEASAAHATLGKRWLGLRVVSVYGATIGARAALVRTLVKLVPWEIAHVALCFPVPLFTSGELPMPRLLFSVYGLLGLYLAAALLTLKKQSVHDLVAGTYVVRVAQRASSAS